MSTCPTVPVKVINIVLKKYLENGIHELPINSDKSLKFSIVRFLGNKVGGKTNNSSNGLNAFDAVMINGYAENNPKIANNANKKISPANERFIRFFFLIFLLNAHF